MIGGSHVGALTSFGNVMEVEINIILRPYSMMEKKIERSAGRVFCYSEVYSEDRGFFTEHQNENNMLVAYFFVEIFLKESALK